MNNMIKKNTYKSMFTSFVLAIYACVGLYAQENPLATFNYQEPFILAPDKIPTFGCNQTVFLRDNKQTIFVLKSYGHSERAIHEALGSFVGASVGIRINRVKIIPPHVPFVGKNPNNKCAATLHTYVPGIEITNIDYMRNVIDIYGGLIGWENLNSLLENDDLCDFVALDLFFDNFDRYKGNYLFDKDTNHFYAIDMDCIFYAARGIDNVASEEQHNMHHVLTDIFRNNVASHSMTFLDTIQSAQLSGQHKKALQRVADTLNKLLSTYPPHKLYALWMQKAKEAEYTYTSVKRGYIRTLIHFNAYHAYKVVDRINELVR